MLLLKANKYPVPSINLPFLSNSFLIECAPASNNKWDQNPSILFFLFKETGLPITQPVNGSLKYFNISFIEFSPTNTSPSVNTQTFPFNSLNNKFKA